MNGEITAREVRVTDPDGESLGILNTRDALAKADELELDLVEIAPQANPPVCKIMDFGKFMFEQKKRAQEAKKKQKQTQVKEIKFRPGTEEGDYQVKFKKIKEFLGKGDRVKVIIWFRGREMAHKDLGLKILERVKVDLTELYEGDYAVEQQAKMEGRQMLMVVAPRSKK